jgi:thiamine-monophosphate kinase
MSQMASSSQNATNDLPRSGRYTYVRATYQIQLDRIRMKREPLTEDSVLKKIRLNCRPLPGNHNSRSLALGIGDDGALFRPNAGNETILTCDWFLEGTHFLRDKHPPDSVGWKCLSRAVSDIAAMGGTPRCFLLSLALPRSLAGRWMDEFLAGLHRASRKFQCVIAGGDTTRRDEVLINVTVVGEVKAGRAVMRSGARAGDILYVSGRLGEAELGSRMLKLSHKTASARNPLIKKHLYPEPRIALGQWLARNRLASSLVDLSDGLSSDLPRLCAASAAGARIEETKLPRVRLTSPPQVRKIHPTSLALHGGDDYELLFTVPPRRAKMMPRYFEGLRLTAIGEITRKRGVRVLTESGHEQLLLAGGWDPFR